MRRCLFQLTSQQMFLKTFVFIISYNCFVAVKVLIVLPETEFKCMILRNLMRSETVTRTKMHKIEQYYFDVSGTL